MDVGIVRALEGDALRGGVDHRVRVTKGQIQVLALELNTVANAGELEDLGVALGDADDHVLDQGAGEAVTSTGLTLVVGAGDGQHAVGERGGQALASRILEIDAARGGVRGELALEVVLVLVLLLLLDGHGDG